MSNFTSLLPQVPATNAIIHVHYSQKKNIVNTTGNKMSVDSLWTPLIYVVCIYIECKEKLLGSETYLQVFVLGFGFGLGAGLGFEASV